MYMHPLPLALLTYTGYWRPVKWPLNSLKCRLYNIYSIIMVFLLNSFALLGFVSALMSKDLKTLIEKLSVCISVLWVCCKVANLFFCRSKIIRVVDILVKDCCIPKDEHEEIIQQKFDRFARKLTIFCEILNETSVFFATLARYHAFLVTRTLPLADWVPYDLSSKVTFIISFVHQSISFFVCANASVAYETLIAWLMIQTCAQLEILCHRARTLSTVINEAQKCSNSVEDFKRKERKIMKSLIQHHLIIYEFATTVNNIFNFMIFVQFSISLAVLCLSIYRMSTTELLSVDFAAGLVYLLAMLTQIYLYCWFGNEVALKSTQIGDAIYEMDWIILPINVIKDLIIIMARSRKSIKMSSGHIVILSTESFMSLMKLSYSSFNLLKDTSR